MSTTVKSTELDFFEIKENLKLFLQQKEEFEDYDFDGSALSNLLDVLAHNTHFHALISNFTLNEAYLTTAQLRNSVVSLAESLGYIPSTTTSAQSTVTITINIPPDDNVGLESRYDILPGQLKLRGSIDDEPYVFTNRETLVAETSGGDGIYQVYPFKNEADPVRVFEGEERTIQFFVDGSANAVYVIPDEHIDASTAIIKLFETQSEAKSSNGAYRVFNNVFDATTIEATSRLYILRESPNKFYELTFGDNNSLGETPEAGNVIDVNYLRSNGADANGVASMNVTSSLQFGAYTVEPASINVVLLNRAAGGDDREEVESIRKKAPFQYAAQNRMVTSLDYEALILRKFSNFITDIICWGGEDDYRRDYGAVYTSVVWKENLSSTTIGELRTDIRQLVKDLSTVSFQLKFMDPTETWLSTEVFYQYNPVFSALTESSVNNTVKGVVSKYFAENTGQFEQVFRRSNLLTQIDESDPSILSSRASVKMQKRMTPILTLTENHELSFPVSLAEPTSRFRNSCRLRPVCFSTKNKTVYIRNKLNDKVKVSPEGQVPIVFDRLPSTTLEAVDLEGNVVISNVGYYEPEEGTVLHQRVERGQYCCPLINYIKVFGIPSKRICYRIGVQ